MSVKYTEAQEARLKAVAAEGRVFDLALCNEIANEKIFAGKTGRSLVAKVRSMNLPYQKVERKDKTGAPVAHKSDLAERLEKIVGQELPNLDGAGKIALQRLVAFAESVTADAE